MISKMYKLSCLIYHREYDSFLDELRKVGVVHVVTKQQGEPEPEVLADMQRLSTAKNLSHELALLVADRPLAASSRPMSVEEINAGLEQYKIRVQDLQQHLTVVNREIDMLEPWGDFEWDTLRKIEAAGWVIQFYSCMERQFEDTWVEDYHAIVVAREIGKIWFVTLNPQRVEVDAEPLQLPAESLTTLMKERDRLELQLEEARNQLVEFATQTVKSLEQARIEVQNTLERKQVKLSGEQMAAGTVLLLEGWVPAENKSDVDGLMKRSGVYYEMRMADKSEPAPIKLKNNALVKLYQVITEMYGMPAYNEFDPTPVLAPFFTLFFAYCVGDAGYGLVLIALGFFLKKKISASIRGMMNLIITLGIATTVLGMIFGTFFGVSLVDVDAPWLDGIKSVMISGKVPGTTYDKLMVLALAIGVVHIIIAMFIKALVATYRFGFKNSLSEWGWFIAVVGFIATGGLMALERITPDMAKTTFIVVGGIASLGIYFFNNLRRNILINIGAGLWDTYNMATGLVGDVLSYIRLYALGLAGAMLGLVFNQLAFMIHIEITAVPLLGDILTWVICGLILVFGHALNIAMSCLSGFVHPLRLTFVEYFKNSGYEGTGTFYKPFKEIKSE